MKKLTLLLIAMIAAFVTPAAHAFNVNFIIDDVTRVRLVINDTELTDLHNGSNPIDVHSGSYVTVRAREGCSLISVVEVEAGYEDNPYERPIYNNECEWMIYGDYGLSYTITSAKADDARDATAHIWVDDPAKVNVSRGDNGVWLDLEPGNNDVPFDSSREKTFLISPADPDRPLYKVTHNGNDITAAGNIRVDLSNNDNLHIEADYPDVKYRVTLSVNGDYPDDRFVQTMYVDGTPVDYNVAMSGGVMVNAGSKVQFKTDTRTWNVLSFSVNGSQTYYTDMVETIVTADTEFSFTVEKYITLRVTVKVDNPDNVTVYRGQHYNGDIVDLGGNTSVAVDVRRDTPIITFIPTGGHYLASVAVGDYTYTPEELKAPYLAVGSLVEGETIEVTTGTYSRTGRAAIIVNGFDKVSDYLKVTRSAGEAVTGIADGYNEILFDDWDNPFTVDCRGPQAPYVYVNEQPADPTYPESYVYEVTLHPGDVVKTFFDDAPAAGSLSLDIDPAVEGAVTITRDRLGQLSATATYAVLEGAVITVAPSAVRASAPEIGVILDGEVLAPEADGSFTFTVTGSHTLTVTTAAVAGLSAIEASAGMAVRVDGREVIVTGAASDVALHAADGRIITTAASAPEVRFGAVPGVYIVRSATTAVKVAVR